MPSLSGYSTSEGLHDGHGSFAPAPGQQAPDISPTAGALSLHMTKPFWAQETDVEHPMAKETENIEANAANSWQAASLFALYVGCGLLWLLTLMTLQLS